MNTNNTNAKKTGPVAAAVLPLLNAAKHRAAKEAKDYIRRMMDKLEEHGMDATAAFPYPKDCWASDYKIQIARHNDIQRFTESAVKGCRHHRAPDPRVPSADGQQRFVSQAIIEAEAQYLAFVAKLEKKVGEASSATLEGDHVWSTSVLTVAKPDGTTERWHTQQIVNVSKLGLLFNQWPTRRLK